MRRGRRKTPIPSISRGTGEGSRTSSNLQQRRGRSVVFLEGKKQRKGEKEKADARWEFWTPSTPQRGRKSPLLNKP